jgi:hypothetical protein
MSFENRRGPNRRKKKNMFCKYESFFFQLSLVLFFSNSKANTWAMKVELTKKIQPSMQVRF